MSDDAAFDRVTLTMVALVELGGRPSREPSHCRSRTRSVATGMVTAGGHLDEDSTERWMPHR